MENPSNLTRNVKKTCSAYNCSKKCEDKHNKIMLPTGSVLFQALTKEKKTHNFPPEDISVQKVPESNNEIDIEDMKPDTKSLHSNTNDNDELEDPQQMVERDDLSIDLFYGVDDLSDSDGSPLEGIGEETCNDNVNTPTIKISSQILNTQQPTNTFLEIPAKKPGSDVVDLQNESSSRRKQKLTIRTADLSEKNTANRPYNCNLCERAFVSPSKLQQHKRIHSAERPFKCTLCPMAFKQPQHLKCHGRVHTGERPFKCSFCNNCYTTSSVLRKHVRLHKTSPEREPYKCTLCDMKFKHRQHLTTQHEIGHKEVKTYGRSTIDKKFNEVERFKNHEGTHLTTQMKYKCPICHKSFQEYNLMKVHEKIHTGDAESDKYSSYQKEVTGLNSLTLHTENHEEKPFKCSVCHIAFSTSAKMIRHEGRHTKDAKMSLVSAQLKES